jgi:hypothetical protein
MPADARNQSPCPAHPLPRTSYVRTGKGYVLLRRSLARSIDRPKAGRPAAAARAGRREVMGDQGAQANGRTADQHALARAPGARILSPRSAFVPPTRTLADVAGNDPLDQLGR